MRICHLTSAHKRHDIRICEKECVSLAKEKNEVYLIVSDNKRDEVYKGVHILSTGYLPDNRFLRMTKAVRMIEKKARAIHADIYHIHDPELLPIVSQLKRIGKVIYDAHEDVHKQILDKEYLPYYIRKPIATIFDKYMRSKIRKIDGVISVTPLLVNELKKVNKHTIMVTNYPIISDKECIINQSEDNNEAFVFYAGGVVKQWCHTEVAEAVSKIDSVKYVIAGSADYEEYLNNVIETGKGKVEYLGRISHDEVMRYYSKAIAGMALLQCTQVGEEGTLGNTKLFEIMQTGKPVICSDLSLWRKIVDEYKCGICVNANDVNEIEKAIRYLYLNREVAIKMGERGAVAVMQQYNWANEEKKLIRFYRSMEK